MSAPAYNPALSPVKNLQALLRGLSITGIKSTVENTVAQVLHYVLSTAMSLAGTLSVAGNVTFGAAVIESAEALSGAGAIGLTTGVTKFTSTGAAQALTLADGTEGQVKRIVHVVDGGSGVLTPTTKTGFSTITFTNAGDSATLMFFATSGWIITGLNGAVAA